MSWIVSIVIAGLMTVSASDFSTANFTARTTPAKPLVRTAAPDETTSQEKFDQTYPLAANGRVSLENLNGSVTIEAWDNPQARVEAIKTVECDRPMKIEIRVQSTANSLRIETEYEWENNKDGWRNGGYRCKRSDVEYKLMLPRTAQIDEIETVNGSISINGMTDLVKASTVNGKITARNVRGTIDLSSVNGTLDADFDSLDNVREVKIDMVNGTINLTLPSDVEATVKADTVNGSIANDFGLPVRKGEYVGRDLYGKLGSGTLPIKLNGVNGSINIRRKQDGRTIKPATNLLPPKGEGDEDDYSVSVAPKPPKPPRTPRVAVAPNPAPVAAPVIVGEVIDAKTREEIRAAVRQSTEIAREATKAAKIDREKLKAAAKVLDEESRDMERELAAAERELARLDRENRRLPQTWYTGSERETSSITVEGKPELTINANGGSVMIRGWDKPEIAYTLVRRHGDEPATPTPNANFKKDGKRVTLTVAAGNEDSTFRLEIFVPRQTDIKLNSDRQIRIEGVKGELKLTGGEQSIDVRDAGGNLVVAATEGNVRVIGFDGTVDAKTVGGLISLEGNFKQISTNTMSGNTILTLPENASAVLEATTKDVRFDGIKPNGESKDLKTSTVWRIGNAAGDEAAKYKFKTTAGGQIYIRSNGSVQTLRSSNSCPTEGEIYAE